MKKTYKEPSIQLCMTRNIILYVLIPLFFALAVLCGLLNYNLSAGTIEAYQMMFNQNILAIDSAILQSNYASSTMITYTGNIRLLQNYYQAQNEYEKFSVISHIENMISNCQAIALNSFQGEMILLMNDGRIIDAIKTADISDRLSEYDWWEDLQKTGSILYWNGNIQEIFEPHQHQNYVAFGRQLMRYKEEPLGYALVRIPSEKFFQFSEDPQFQDGTLALFSSDGRIIASDGGTIKNETLKNLYQYWKNRNENTGKWKKYFYMASRLDSCGNSIVYAIEKSNMFRRVEIIFISTIVFMIVTGVGLVAVIIYLSHYIAKPILFFADRICLIEQHKPEMLILNKHHYKETKVLEEGMIRAQKRINLLVKEVRRETEMKEKARYDALRAQITPHFLFNTLNAIRWKASLNHDEEVADILSDLGVLLSEAYRNTDELERIENAMLILDAYVKIMQIRFGDKVQFFFSVSEEIREYLIPRFCLQPLVENSFIHGMGRVKDGIIVLRGEKQGKDILFTLIDNGSGLQGKQIDLTKEHDLKQRGISGIGLPNIHKRIQILFGKEYGLYVDNSLEVGFKISLKIPAITETDKKVTE